MVSVAGLKVGEFVVNVPVVEGDVEGFPVGQRGVGSFGVTAWVGQRWARQRNKAAGVQGQLSGVTRRARPGQWFLWLPSQEKSSARGLLVERMLQKVAADTPYEPCRAVQVTRAAALPVRKFA